MKLGVRLLILLLIAALPVLALQVYGLLQDREQRKAEIADQARDLARLVAAQQDQFIEGARYLLAAAAQQTPRPRLLEYPIWLWERTVAHRDPTAREVVGWRLDIGPVLERKRAAIEAHRSQLTDLIADAQFAFRLEPDFLANFARPWELFLEERSGE